MWVRGLGHQVLGLGLGSQVLVNTTVSTRYRLQVYMYTWEAMVFFPVSLSRVPCLRVSHIPLIIWQRVQVERCYEQAGGNTFRVFSRYYRPAQYIRNSV